MKKKTRKIILITTVVVLLVAGLFFVIYKVSRNGTVDVYPVSYMADSGFGADSQLSATISSGKVQNVYLKEGMVNSVNVNVGDVVQKGDILMNYDQTSFALALQKSKADIALLESRVAKYKENALRLRGLIPAESAPEPTVETIDHGALDIKETLTEADAAADDAQFLISLQTKLQVDYLKKLREEGFTATFSLYENDTLYGTYVLDGNTIPQETERFVPVAESEPPVFEKELYDAITEDWQLKNIITLSSEFAVSAFDPAYPYTGTFTPCKPVKYERFETVYHDNYVVDENGNYAYTKAELAEMIKAEEENAKNAAFDLREAKIRYAQDELTAKDGNVVASVSGTVTEVRDINGAFVGDTIIVIKGDDNFIVTAYINEMYLDTVKEGDSLSFMAYQSGINATATIREIGSIPMDGSYGYGMENPNSSYYPIEAVVDDHSLTFYVGEWCEASLVSEEERADTFYIPLMYIRSDEGGNYAYVAENDRLKKRYLSTGKILWGYEIEIRAGLTTEDYIAFPYGKHVNDGAKAAVSEDIYY